MVNVEHCQFNLARQKGTVSPKRKEKASHNMFIMLFASLINDHVNYEKRHSQVGRSEKMAIEWNQHILSKKSLML